jgi:hypothetical protein
MSIRCSLSAPRAFVFTVLLFTPLLALWPSGPARAEEGKEADVEAQTADLEAEAAALEDAVQEHEKAGDVALLVADVGRAAALYARADTAQHEEVRDAMVDLVCDLVRSRAEEVEVAALRGLGQMGDEDGYRAIKPYLRPHDDPEYREALRTAIEVSGLARHDRLVSPLIRMVEKSENYTVAADAMTALSHYSDSRLRERIVESLAKTVAKNKPSGGWTRSKKTQSGDDVGQKQGTGASDRWATLSPKLVETLNTLTGQKFIAPGDWFDMIDEYERDLSVLFVDR